MVNTPGMGELLINTTDLIFNHSPQVIGYVSTYTKVEGMDILLSLMIVQTIFLGVILYNTIPKSEEL